MLILPKTLSSKRKREIQIHGLPYQLWNRENFNKNGDGAERAIARSCTLKLTKLDAVRIKIRTHNACLFASMMVSDGIKMNKISILPLKLEEDE